MTKATILRSLLLTTAIAVTPATLSAADARTPAEISAVFMINPGSYREDFIASSAKLFRRTAGLDNVIEGTDKNRFGQVAEARALATVVSQFVASDLDGDGYITADEFAAANEAWGSLDQVFGRWDADTDGKVSQEEWFNSHPKGNKGQPIPGAAKVDEYLGVDPNADGKLTLAELTTLADKVFSKYDRDGDDQISIEEASKWRNAISDAREREMLQKQADLQKARESAGEHRPQIDLNKARDLAAKAPTSRDTTPEQTRSIDDACAFPTLDPKEKLVLFSVNSGVQPIDLALGDEASVIDVAVEPGNDPLYVVLPSYSTTVWRFTGAVDRVSKVVPTAIRRADNSGVGLGGSGVIGIPAKKVSFLKRWNCLSYFGDAVGEAKARGQLAETLGRQPDFKGYVQATSQVSIPSMTANDSGTISPWATGRTPEKIDPKTVVAAVQVSTWDILPGRMGIEQLISAGYLEGVSGGNSDQYRIVKTFAHFPIGLTGGLQPTFLLSKGVKLPSGSTGWACVIDEETGKNLSGSCR